MTRTDSVLRGRLEDLDRLLALSRQLKLGDDRVARLQERRDNLIRLSPDLARPAPLRRVGW